MRTGYAVVLPFVISLMLLAAGCTQDKGQGVPRSGADTILLAQAQFTTQTDESGKLRTVPGAARLVILRRTGEQWKRELLEDPDSNVFHKAVSAAELSKGAAESGILTIGANSAAIKLWQPGADGWSAKTLWKTSFGGKHDRLRDFEIGDVTADGTLDIVIATHDQGVVAVLTRTGDAWKAVELDRKADTFVHEIEVGDLDGDGTPEIYTTPSQPNRFDGTAQPGFIVVYRHTPSGFERSVVEEFRRRHVKEILVADVEGTGRLSLLAAVEAELGRRPDRPADADQVLIKQFHRRGGTYVGRVVAKLPGKLCRFLNCGDVDGDGKPEVIVSTYRKGLWLLRPGAGEWKSELIDADSGGFEHATALADLDGDGVQEIYVAADEQRQVRRYRWKSGAWKRDTLYDIEEEKMTFGISVGSF